MSLGPHIRRVLGYRESPHGFSLHHPQLIQLQPLAKRHLVYQCSICGRKHVHFNRGGCSCCADNLMHGIEVDEKEWLRLMANE